MRRLTRFLLILLGLHVYIAWRIVPDLPWNAAGKAVVLGAIAASALLVPLGFLARRMPHARRSDRLAYVGLVVAGAFSSLFVLTVLRDIALAVIAFAHALTAGEVNTGAIAAMTAAAVPLSAVLLTGIGFVNARRRARVRSVDIAIPNLPQSLHGFSIAQITDVHVGPTIKANYVSAIVDAVNALRPDVIAVTGDVVDGSVHDLAEHTRPLARLRARHGAYVVTGNHEYYSGVQAWIAEFRRLGLRVLLNEHVVIDHSGAPVVIAGVTDFNAASFDASHRSDPAKSIAGAPSNAAVKVLLAHQPRSAFAAAGHGFDLQLSGHTHGGQFLPWNFFVRMQQPFTSGLHRLHDLRVYVSRGTGYWGPPKRLGAPSEITLVRLVPA